ncbi:hypothetical protein [Thomasclavelia sp.]
MKNIRKQRIIIFTIILILGSLLFIHNKIQTQLIKERKLAAQTILKTFYENLDAKFAALNYATQLSCISDDKGKVDLELFNKKAYQLLEKNSYITYIAYFNGDVLESILPETGYGDLKGKSLNELPYSYTLAKVVKKTVVEGPKKLSINDKNVFLFIEPIIIDNNYKGEIIAALDKDYVIKQMNLELLNEGRYDYELWQVNELGKYKTIVATSNQNADFSEALKLGFTLPSNWNISIQPQSGWLSPGEKLLINFSFSALGILIFLLIRLSYLYHRQKLVLQKTRYTDPDSGLYNFEGFCYFVDQIIKKRPQINLFLVYIHLSGYHEISHIADKNEIKEYFLQIYKNIQTDFPKDTISAKISEDIIALAVFKSTEDKKINDVVDEFIIQLFWKKKIGNKKEFVNPEFCIVKYPGDGTTTDLLLQQAEEILHNNNLEK